MCGFVGIFNADGGIAELKHDLIAAGTLLSHRGADDEGIYFDDFWGVCFNRLSIVDTSQSGHQPMLSESGRYVLVFNGEIYNYRELRALLSGKGFSFRGNSDTEVLLNCFEYFGISCLERLRGMFACAVWDRDARELWIFRDRLGIKPLYLCKSSTGTIISSEIKAIKACIRATPAISEKAVFKYLSRGWLDDSSSTFYGNIEAVPPASWIRIAKDGSITRSEYWRLHFANRYPFDAEEFRNEFRTTVALHLNADVPLAATLSGGMDSSSIVAVASKAVSSPDRIQAFSVLPPDTVDESPWINRTVAHCGIWHQYLSLDSSSISAIVDKVLLAHDEPFQSSSCIFQYLLRKEVAGMGIKVLLVGEGGDEVLGGYRRLFYPFLYSLKQEGRWQEFRCAVEQAPEFMAINREEIEFQLCNYERLIASGASGQENTSAYDLLAPQFIAAHNDIVAMRSYPCSVGEHQNYFFAHLAEHLSVRDIPYVLRMEDRNSMAHGVESRVPFLDHIFLEKVFSFHYSEFMASGRNKAMLRKAMVGLLPDEVLNRMDKSPRPGNNAHLMYNLLQREMLETLDSVQFRVLPYFSDKCNRLFSEDCLSRNPVRAEIWFRIYLLVRWLTI